MPKKMIWLSFDLGLDGDYDGLYEWLDQHEAKECGESCAVLEYSFEKDLLEELKEDIGNSITVNKNARIYIVFRKQDGTKVKGSFLFGKRKRAPWVGRSVVEDVEEEGV